MTRIGGRGVPNNTASVHRWNSIWVVDRRYDRRFGPDAGFGARGIRTFVPLGGRGVRVPWGVREDCEK